jgi:mannobiose 2-epimerase
MSTEKITRLQEEAESELVRHILPFWMKRMPDHENGGFLGRIDGYGNPQPEAVKGGILNARILWTFAAAYGRYHEPAYLHMVERAREYIFTRFFDREYGGTYWYLTHEGKPGDTKKQIYSLAFFIYALAEAAEVTGNPECLEYAVTLYRLIEDKSFDTKGNGYFEAYSRDWIILDDLRLSDKDENEKKTTNTHLHILEAYTGLFRLWKEKSLGLQLKNLVNLFLNRMIDNRTSHLRLFFDENWNCKTPLISYGHDIEAAWLLYEAAKMLGDHKLLAQVEKAGFGLIRAASEGLQDDGSMIYEKESQTGPADYDRHWWPQAEAVVGFLHGYELSHEDIFLSRAVGCWDYITSRLIDTEKGEWFWSIRADGSANREDDKAGFWKCPYHNARACMEIISRGERLKTTNN